jgi:ATP-binding cassette subfamily B protein
MPLNQVSQQLTAILSALAGAERIFEIMDMEPETDKGMATLVPAFRDINGGVKEQPGGTRTGTWAWKIPREGGGYDFVELRGDVRLTNVEFGYLHDKPVLKKVSVYANHGQKIAFVGSTGAGKTTITNLLNRFYEIDGGSITYDGIDIRDIKKDDLRRSMGAVLQDTHLFTGTVMDNIRYGRLEATDEECISAAKSSNAHSFIRRLPEGYQTMVTSDGSNLSQGQRQLLAIARAAVADPPVMVLDEATSSIDTRQSV